MTYSRRDVFRLLAGLGLAACDTKRPTRGGLGIMERVNEKLEEALQSDREVAATNPLTPEEAFPSYHIAREPPIAPADWKLVLGGNVNRRSFGLDDLRALPAVTYRLKHHCVEGWSAVADWTGVRLRDLAALVGATRFAFVEFRSFDRDGDGTAYWSSWDRRSAMHPQTLIAWAFNGKPLTPAHGAPVRLYAATKLGYKQVKYLTEINFRDDQTGGYWENLGYEWFAGV